MLCKRIVSSKMRGLYELKRHSQRDCHFWADQTFRGNHCPGKVRGRDSRLLYGSKLRACREFYRELDVPDLYCNRPFYYDVLERKPFSFTSEKSGIRMQTNLMMIILKGGGSLVFGGLLDLSGSCKWFYSID